MGVEAPIILPDQLIEDKVAQVILGHAIVEERQESFVDNQGHKNVEGEPLVIKIAQEARSHVVHPLAVANLRQNESHCLQDVEELLRLLLGKEGVGQGILGALQVEEYLMLQLAIQGALLDSD